jgi:tRNA (guanosine-2'-O-)-methyltransferase
MVMELTRIYPASDFSSEQLSLLGNHLSDFIYPERCVRLNEILSLRTRHCTVVLEDLYQTQNISAVIRTCECLGVQDVHIIEGENEFQIHEAISMGASKWLTFHNYPFTTTSKQDAIASLKQKGYKIVATLPSENSSFISQLPIDEKSAFLFGTELSGLSEELIALSDCYVKIPMYGFTESFNISNSVAILLSGFVEKLRNSTQNWRLSTTERDELLFEWLQKSIKKPDLIIDRWLKEKK